MKHTPLLRWLMLYDIDFVKRILSGLYCRMIDPYAWLESINADRGRR